MATIKKRGNGYTITVSNGYDINGKQIRVYSTWTPEPGMTAKQIEKALARESVLFEESVRNGCVTVSGKIRLVDFCDKFMEEYAKLYLKPNTIANYKRDLQRIRAALGHVRLDELKPGHISSFYANLQEEGINQHTNGTLESSSIGSIHRTLSAILGKAVRWGYITSSPCGLAERPRAAQKEARYLDEEDARKLLTLLWSEPIKWRAPITFDLLSGLRRGELLGLRWRDIDFEAQTITIRQTSNYTSGQGIYTGTPKTATSKRPLHLAPAAFTLLNEYRAWQDAQRIALGDAWKGEEDDNRIFTRDDGQPMFPTALTQWFHKFVLRSELPSVSVHSLRHTYASLMLADGVPLVIVSGQLGHAKASTTADIYGHVIASAQAKALQTFDKFSDVVAPATMPLESDVLKQQTTDKRQDEKKATTA